MTRLVFLVLFTLYASVTGGQTINHSLTLQEANKYFLDNNLLLLAERYNIEIADAEIIQARLFENPVVSVDHNIYNRLSGRYFDFGAEGQTEVEIEQIIYLAGQRNKRIKLEKINKETAVYEFEELLRTLRNELHTQFIQLYYARQSEEVYNREITSVENLLQMYEEQYEKKNISLLEKARLQALLLSLEQEKNELTDEIITLQAGLRLLTGLPAETFPVPVLDELILNQIDLSAISLPGLLTQLTDRPDLKVMNSNILASKANVKVQKAEAAPEFSIRGTYDRAGGIFDNYFALGVSLSVPVFNRNQGGIKSAKASVLQHSVLEQYAREQAGNELLTSYARLEKALELYHKSHTGLDKDFETLLDGINDNFRKRNISLLEFIDYYQAYKETCLQMNTIRKDLLLAVEEFNTVAGSPVLSYYK